MPHRSLIFSLRKHRVDSGNIYCMCMHFLGMIKSF